MGESFESISEEEEHRLFGKRYGIDALGAMAQGLFCSLLIGTIVKTLGQQMNLQFLIEAGGYCSAMSGPAMAIAIGYALQAPPLVLFSLATVGYVANALGSTTLSGAAGAGGPLAVLFIAIAAAEAGKAVSKETRVDILVTPLVTILSGVALSALVAPAIGTAASSVGEFVEWATVLQPFWMGMLVSVAIGAALTLPISSAAICAALGLTGLAGGAAVAGCCAQMVGPIGVYAGWVNDVATGAKASITGMDWLAMALICFILPAVLTWLIGIPCRRLGWIRDGDLKLD